METLTAPGAEGLHQQHSQTLLGDEQLVRLFDTDLKFLQENGDLDIFYFDQETGYDGLSHVLVGDNTGGFHSETASQVLGLNHPSNIEKTMVERQHLESKNSKYRRPFRERPFEPFGSRVVIDGDLKVRLKPNEDGSYSPAVNSMFPSEYDPTSIVRAVAIAYKNMDVAADQDSVSPTDGKQVVVNKSGWVPMLDGSSKMQIEIVMDPESRKIITAYPEVKHGGYMGLTEAQAHDLLLNG